jgi:parallel beta-helix repeat protein
MTGHHYPIMAFGAIGDGETLNTGAIQEATDAATTGGGGTVLAPPGGYLTGTIYLRGHVTLYLEAGATLLGSTDLTDYPPEPPRRHASRETHHLIVAKNARDVTITGRGTIDGQGVAFWEPQPDPDRWIRAKPKRPSQMVQIVGCYDVVVEGVRLTNPAGCTLRLQDSEPARVHGVTIDNDRRTPNSDGIDVTGCRDLRISDCTISTCDDGIVLKSDSGPVERVTVTNCVIRTMCAALKLGTNGTYHDIRQITFSNGSIYESHRGVAI